MSHENAAAGREPAADALCSRPPTESHQSEQFTRFLEDIAAHGLPDPENCQPWEELRDRRLAELADQQSGPRTV